MAEDLTEYLHEQGIRVRYMHSDIDTLERIEIIRDLRLGAFDALVGINLLREGLDIPECALVAILDADKEGFLRSETSLIQTIGRAARNIDGKVILYADQVTGSMQRAMEETNRRREKQERLQHRQRHHAGERSRNRSATSWPASTSATTCWSRPATARPATSRTPPPSATISRRCWPTSKTRMREAAADLDFEEAARLRDELKRLRATELAVVDDPTAKRISSPSPAGRVARARRAGWGSRPARSRPHKPDLDEMGIALYHERVAPSPGTEASEARRPAQADARRDGPGPESKPYRARTSPRARARPPASPACTAAGRRKGVVTGGQNNATPSTGSCRAPPIPRIVGLSRPRAG